MARAPKWIEAHGDTGDGMFVIDARQRVVYWNRAAEDLLGYRASEVLHRHCYDVLRGRSPAGAARCRKNCSVQRCLQRGARVQSFDLLATAKSGNEVRLTVSIISLRRDGGLLTLHLLRNASKEQQSEEVIERVLRLLQRHQRLPAAPVGRRPRTSAGTARANLLNGLTERELEVLGDLARGLSTRSIAARCGISLLTVRNHIRNILGKTGFHSRTQLIAYALRKGLL